MSRAPIEVAVDGGKTYVFRPIVNPNPMISQYVDTSNGAAVLFDRLGIELRPASANNDGTRVVHRLNLPLAQEIGPGNSAGYVAAPKAAGENKAVLNISVSKLSGLTETEAFVDLIQAYVASDAFRDTIVDQLIPQ